MVNLLLFGPPGAGKGTQTQFLVERYGLVKVATGDIIRNEITNGTPLGLEAQKQMQGGNLASDEIVISIIKSFLDNAHNSAGHIFDGFPRTIAQAECLDTMLNNMGFEVTALISLEVPQDELLRRIIERGKVSGREDDADIDIVRNRLKIYEDKTKVVKEYYSKQNKCFEIDGTMSMDDVTKGICTIIDKA